MTLSSTGPVSIPASVTVPAGATTAGFSISTAGVTSPSPGASVLAISAVSTKLVNPATATISAAYAGVTKAAVLTIKKKRR